MTAVGAFAYVGPTSRNAAVVANITSRDNSVKISAGASAPNGTGAVIAEVYDATPASAYTTSLPRLVNFSVIKQINAGDTLTLGFTIDGTASKTVLIRVIGPALGQFGYTSSSTLNDPQLTLYNSRSVVVSSNNDWAGNAQVAAAITATGAFPVANTASKDAMFVATLAPDGYTAQASGVGGHRRLRHCRSLRSAVICHERGASQI